MMSSTESDPEIFDTSPELAMVWPGAPFPLGATYDGAGTNFSLFSEVADKVGRRHGRLVSTCGVWTQTLWASRWTRRRRARWSRPCGVRLASAHLLTRWMGQHLTAFPGSMLESVSC